MMDSRRVVVARQGQRIAFAIGLICLVLAIGVHVAGKPGIASGLLAAAVIGLLLGAVMAGIATSE